MHPGNIFSIRELLFAYDKVPALSIGSLDFEKGGIHVLLGPNGSGKTTLLKILNQLLWGWEGSILFKDSPLKNTADGKRLSELREKSVYVHQGPLLFTGTVYDNAAFGLRVRKTDPKTIHETVTRVLELVGLKEFSKRKAHALSSGETQRTALARALALTPEVLFLDEPTASVDKANTALIEELLENINRTLGTTIIISTHNLPFAYRICRRLIHLENGREMPPGENILEGTVAEQNANFNVFDSAGVRLACPLGEGNPIRAVIDYDRILLSREIRETSAQNNLPCEILRSEDCRGKKGLCDVTLKARNRDAKPPENAASVILRARITDLSRETLKLAPGTKAWVSFKSSSIRLY